MSDVNRYLVLAHKFIAEMGINEHWREEIFDHAQDPDHDIYQVLKDEVEIADKVQKYDAALRANLDVATRNSGFIEPKDDELSLIKMNSMKYVTVVEEHHARHSITRMMLHPYTHKTIPQETSNVDHH